MDKIKLITTREDAHSIRAEIVGHPEAGIHHGKKETIAIAKIAEHNKLFFNLHEPGGHDSGLKIRKEQIGKKFYAIVQDHPEIRFEYADSFEEALGQLIKHNEDVFNVSNIHHVGK